MKTVIPNYLKNKPVSPVEQKVQPISFPHSGHYYSSPIQHFGLTYHEHLVAHAIAGLCTAYAKVSPPDPTMIAKTAADIADATIRELEDRLRAEFNQQAELDAFGVKD